MSAQRSELRTEFLKLKVEPAVGMGRFYRYHPDPASWEGWYRVTGLASEDQGLVAALPPTDRYIRVTDARAPAEGSFTGGVLFILKCLLG